MTISLSREQIEELARPAPDKLTPLGTLFNTGVVYTHIYCPKCWALLSSRNDSRNCQCGNEQPVKHGHLGLVGDVIKWCNAQRFPVIAAAIAAADPETFKETWAAGMQEWEPLPYGYLDLPDEVIDDINRSERTHPRLHALGIRARLNFEIACLRAMMGDDADEPIYAKAK